MSGKIAPKKTGPYGGSLQGARVPAGLGTDQATTGPLIRNPYRNPWCGCRDRVLRIPRVRGVAAGQTTRRGRRFRLANESACLEGSIRGGPGSAVAV